MKRVMSLILVLLLTMVTLTSCKVDKDKNGKDDRTESNGNYRIDYMYSTATVKLSDIDGNKNATELWGNVSGNLLLDDTTYKILGAKVYAYEKSGNLWYGWIDIQDPTTGNTYDVCLYFVRSGIGTYVSTQSVDIGVQVKGNGGNLGASWTSTVYNEYGRVMYLKFGPYDYMKK